MKTAEITRSAEAQEGLFTLILRRWSLAAGRVILARRLGVTKSMLTRALGGATPSFDLAYRLHKVCNLSWPAVFTAYHGVSRNLVVNADTLSSVERREPEAVEEELRARLRAAVGKIGLVECAGSIGIPPSSLHSYLESTRLPLSLIWRVHLLTSIPYTKLITGEEDEQERDCAKRVGRADDTVGRFPDAVETLVRHAELHAYNEVDPPRKVFPHLERLFRQRLTRWQKARLALILGVTCFYQDQVRKAASYARKGWSALKNLKKYEVPLAQHAALAGHLGLYDHAREVGRQVMTLTRDRQLNAQIRRLMAEYAIEQLDVNGAAVLSRRALRSALQNANYSRQVTFPILQDVLANAAWLAGDIDEAVWRSERVLGSTHVLPVIRRYAAEQLIGVHIWTRDPVAAGRALAEYRKCTTSMLDVAGFARRTRIYEWRLLLMKRDTERGLSAAEHKRLEALSRELATISGERWIETIAAHAVCIYRARGKKEGLRGMVKHLLAEGGFVRRAPVYTLPDLIETIREAGVETPALRAWHDKAVRRGMVFFEGGPHPFRSEAARPARG